MRTRAVAGTGVDVTVLGVGGAPLGGNFAELTRDDAVGILETALDAGIKYFDTAPYYGFGRSERVVGDVLRGRDHVLSTKVGRLLAPGAVDSTSMFGPLPFHPVYDYTYDGIIRSFEDSLQRLGLDRIDLLLVHDIGEITHGSEANARHFGDLRASGTRALAELKADGRVKGIGLGVNENEILIRALDIGAWDVFLLAGRYTLLEQTSLDELFPRCAAAGTSIVCGGPFNSGVLVGRETWNYARAPADVVTKVKRLRAVADRHGVELPAAALQFPLGHDLVVSVIPGSRSGEEFRAILAWADADIPDGFWHDLRGEGLLHPEAPVPQGNPYR